MSELQIVSLLQLPSTGKPVSLRGCNLGLSLSAFPVLKCVYGAFEFPDLFRTDHSIIDRFSL